MIKAFLDQIGPLRFPKVFLTALFQIFYSSYTGLLTVSNVYYILLCVRRSSKNTAYCSYHSHLPWQLKEKIQFKNTTKSSIKTMDISILLNTDFGNLNN